MMHKDVVGISIEAARQMIPEQFPQYKNHAIEPLLNIGTDHSIFRVGSAAVAKFPLRSINPAMVADALRCEAAAMIELASCCPVPTPRPIGLGQPSPTYPQPWILQTWVEGEIAKPEGLCNSHVFARDLADLLESLRQADMQDRRFDGTGRGGCLRDHDEWIATCVAKSEGLLDVGKLQRLWARFRELPASTSTVMSHRDLIPANLLVRGERLVGVLDGGGFGPADSSLDLVAAWHLLDQDRRAILRNQLGSNDIEWRRGAAWAFQQAIGLVWYYEQTNPAMSALGRSTLARIVADTEI